MRHFALCFGADVTNLNEPPSTFLFLPGASDLIGLYMPELLFAVVNLC